MVLVEFRLESDASREREMPAVPRVGDTVVWMSTDDYPDMDAPGDTDTGFVVAKVQWTIFEPDGGQITAPEASVRVDLVREEPHPRPGQTPPWMQFDDYDRGEVLAQTSAERRRAQRTLEAAQAHEDEVRERLRA